MNPQTWGTLTIIFNLLIPPSIFFLIEKVIKKKFVKILVGILGLSVITASAFISWNVSNKEMTFLGKRVDELTILYSNTSTKLENLLYLIRMQNIKSPEMLGNFFKYYAENPSRYLEIKNFSEDEIPIKAIIKKYDGFKYFKQENLSRARECFFDALKISPNYYTAMLGLAMIDKKMAYDSLEEDNRKQALEYLKVAEQNYKKLQGIQYSLNIKDPSPFYQLAHLYIDVKPEYNVAEELLIKALRIDPQCGEAYNLLGLLYEHRYYFQIRDLKYIELSISLYDKAIEVRFYISKINAKRLEDIFGKIDTEKMKEVVNNYLIAN